jgi:hypothetical protein
MSIAHLFSAVDTSVRWLTGIDRVDGGESCLGEASELGL